MQKYREHDGGRRIGTPVMQDVIWQVGIIRDGAQKLREPMLANTFDYSNAMPKIRNFYPL